MRYDALAKLVDEVPQIVALKDNPPYIEKFARTAKVLGRKISLLNGPGNLINRIHHKWVQRVL